MSDSLADCLDALVAAARDAGIDEATARAEGEALAATVAERSKGAFVDWAQQTGRTGGAEDFFVAAKQGNRFRAGPTPAMSQLALGKSEQAPSYARALGEVAIAATLLGQPGPEAVGTAAMVTAAQLGEARTLMPSSSAPGAFDLPGRRAGARGRQRHARPGAPDGRPGTTAARGDEWRGGRLAHAAVGHLDHAARARRRRHGATSR